MKPMTHTQFSNALETLKLTPTRAVAPLGITRRHVHRLASGDRPVPLPVQILIELYLHNPKLLRRFDG